MKNEFQIKEDEILFFVDYNKTLVNYDSLDVNLVTMFYDAYSHSKPLVSMLYLTKSLNEFKQKTGLTPVIVVVSNASLELKDYDDSIRILSDFFNIFIRNKGGNENCNCSQYFKYIICKENDGFFKINQGSKTFYDAYTWIPFGEEELKIKKSESFKKLESVERLMRLLDAKKLSRNLFFAGNDIKDDYPMKLVQTDEGVCKIFVRPGRSRRLTYSKQKEFCEAKGHVFSSRTPKHEKIKCLDNFTVSYLNEIDRNAIENFDDGDHVILTQENSNGLIEGIRKAADIIANSKQKQTNFQL